MQNKKIKTIDEIQELKKQYLEERRLLRESRKAEEAAIQQSIIFKTDERSKKTVKGATGASTHSI